nr:hypothetical protein VITISV_017763 [Ipomoea batatas]
MSCAAAIKNSTACCGVNSSTKLVMVFILSSSAFSNISVSFSIFASRFPLIIPIISLPPSYQKLVGNVIFFLDGLALELADAAELGRSEVAEVAVTEAAEDVHDVGLEEDAGLGVDEVEHGGGAPPADPLVFFSNSLGLQGVDLVELSGRNIRQTTRPLALEVPLELGVEVGPAERVDEADGERGSAPADPHEGVLESSAPRGRQEGRPPVLLGQQRPVLLVLLEVPHVLIHHPEQLGRPEIRVHRSAQLLQVLLLLRYPLLEHAAETAVVHGGAAHFNCI